MKRFLAAALALACAFAGPAFAATLTATPATLWTQLAAAKGEAGDHVQLQSGDYGDVPAWNFKKAAPGVTIEPAPGAAVTMSSINASGSTNLTITGFDVTMKPDTQYALTVGGGGQGVIFDHMKVHQANAALLQGVGFWIRNAAGVTVQNSEFYWLGLGGGVMDSDHVLVAGNLIHDVNVDGVDLAGASYVTVSNNLFRDFHPGDGDHPDAIQWWGTADHPTPSYLTISGNEYDRNAGGIAQGIFGGPGDHLTITGNALRGTMYNGISFAGVKNSEIGGNFVQGYPDMGTRIIIRGASDAISIHDNVTQDYQDYAADGANTNITLARNTLIPAASSPSDATAYNAWRGTPAPPIVTPPPVVVAPPPVVTPPPVVVPPAVNPLQATVDNLTAQVASLTAQLQTATTLAQSQASQITTLKAQLAAATGKITKGRAALK